MSSNKQDSDIPIIKSYLSGDTSSFNELVGRHERAIYNLAYRMTGNAADAADLTQEIFIHLHKKLAAFRGESAFSTWFYRLAVNYSKDWLKKESRRVKTVEVDEATLADGGGNPDQLYEQKEMQGIVQSAILALPEEQRVVVILHDLQGYGYEDIAAIEEVPVGTVKSRLSRARVKLAQKLVLSGNVVKK